MNSKQLIMALGASLSLVTSAMTSSSGNPFQAKQLVSGYNNSEEHIKLPTAECSTDKCSASKPSATPKSVQGKCGAGKCSANKKGTGKCSTGKCGVTK
ncbi:MAG: hypothetical protein Q8L68_06055 [Methylococcales bacterium]|nr:hypothetical protein [Methylococcales bacterium]